MKIGGAPILPYIQVLISAISVTFGGEELSASNAAVSAWCVLLALFVTIFLLSETIAWFREDKDQSSLIALLLLAPLGAVVVLAPHFIMFRYFLFQSIILLLIAARFLIRLASRGSFGALVSTGLVCGFIYGNFRLTWELLTIGRSFFEFNRRTILHLYPEQQWTLGATQVFQTELRLQYGEAWFAAHGSGYTDRMILVADYNQADPGPLHVLRESVDRFESFPDSFVTSAGITYMRAWINRAPLLSGAQAAWYQREDLFRERHPGMRVP
jgi:hypothetical protein